MVCCNRRRIADFIAEEDVVQNSTENRKERFRKNVLPTFILKIKRNAHGIECEFMSYVVSAGI